MPPVIIRKRNMSEKDKKNTPQAESSEKLSVDTDIFKSRKELKKQREEETARQQLEVERRKAQLAKEKQEAYEKKIHDEKIELMRMKQGMLEEEEATIHEEKEEEVKLTFWQKVSNFFYHNKWWLGLGTFFAVMMVFLIVDLVKKPRPDSAILMLCDNNDVGLSPQLEEYFSQFGEDSNGNGEVLVSVYYIPYSTDDLRNYNNGVTGKLSTFLSGTEQVIIIGNDLTVEDIIDPKEDLVDLSQIYPDDPHVKEYFYYLKDTNFAEALGIKPSSIPADMFLAIRTPVDPVYGVNEKMQKTYDKDFPLFDKLVKSLSADN